MINAKLLHLMIDASNNGITIAEQEGDDNILIYVNKAFEELTGFTRDEVLYQDCRFLQAHDRNQPGVRRVHEALLNRQPCREVLRNYRKDGTAFWNELSITPVFSDALQLTYFIGVQKDVTEAVEARQRVTELELELARANAQIESLKGA